MMGLRVKSIGHWVENEVPKDHSSHSSSKASPEVPYYLHYHKPEKLACSLPMVLLRIQQ